MYFNELDLILKMNFQGDHHVLVDVGAHWGMFSESFWRRGWSIIAFEPERRNREEFEKKLGHLPRVVCIPKAVSDVAENRVPFYVSDEHFGIHSLGRFHESHKLAYEVETVRLDQTLSELEVKEVTVLKIDVEGADFLALKSFDFTLWNPQVVMVEFMDKRSQDLFQYTHHDLNAHMASRGYTTFVSEWDEFEDYAKESDEAIAHRWIGCSRYPLDHEPVWGNLIFVPTNQAEVFEKTLRRYCFSAPMAKSVRRAVASIPGARPLYHGVRKSLMRRAAR